MSEENKPEVVQDNSIAQVPEPVQEKQEESIEQVNWRKFRQTREQERKEKIAAQELARKKEEENRALQQALEAVISKPAQHPQEIQEESLDQDQIIDKKVKEAIRLRELELEKQMREREQSELPKRLNNNLADFDKICTEENLDYLDYHYPEIALAYKHMPHSYEKWEGLYKAIKKFIPNQQSSKDSKKVEQNLSKPVAISRPGMTQTGDQAPYKLDEQRKASNWARMQKVLKGIS